MQTSNLNLRHTLTSLHIKLIGFWKKAWYIFFLSFLKQQKGNTFKAPCWRPQFSRMWHLLTSYLPHEFLCYLWKDFYAHPAPDFTLSYDDFDRVTVRTFIWLKPISLHILWGPQKVRSVLWKWLSELFSDYLNNNYQYFKNILLPAQLFSEKTKSKT